MTDMADLQKQAAEEFAEYWKDKGYEKGHCQPFWLSLLRDVYGIEHPKQYISFEDQVHLDNIDQVLKKLNSFRPAQYTDKKEVARVLRRAVDNGADRETVARHIASVQKHSANNPQPTISLGYGIFRVNWRRWIRF